MTHLFRERSDFTCHYIPCGRQRADGDFCHSHNKQSASGEPLRPIRGIGKPATAPEDCAFDGCTDYASVASFCSGHYGQKKRGEPMRVKRGMKRQSGLACVFPGCLNERKTNDLCAGHYSQHFRGGELHALNEVFPCPIPGCTGGYTRNSQSMMCKRHLASARKYGLSVDQLVALWGDNPHCEVCSATSNLHIDHDHACCPGGNVWKCGKCVRGLLCLRCNHMLGQSRDNSAVLRAAADYLDSRAERGLAATA